ncbi:hypothetical protein JVT61DRAFT_5598 [Boletus reticuloceps]|uniref:Uncharacterized protein n=1 Tax=Boletus reticuloceps TaxID=495285 RepID=A0A8I2YZV7_9AGAM|nr:hypothetical protein JVT61DRAFT_5598 [Boletus reticuloceps]
MAGMRGGVEVEVEVVRAGGVRSDSRRGQDRVSLVRCSSVVHHHVPPPSPHCRPRPPVHLPPRRSPPPTSHLYPPSTATPFLQISPSSPVEYLCWPSPDNGKIIDLLGHLPPLPDYASYPTRYTSDPESTVAHVQISSMRMLFHWDSTHGWKYHDLRLMPFPSPSFLTPEESLASSGTDPRSSTLDLVSEADNVNSEEESYWDAYGAAGHDLTSPLPPQGTEAVEGEDAYWAQYASVQGSADSTVPSPLPTHHSFRPVIAIDDESTFPSQNDPIIDIPVDVIHACPLASRLEPPSPNLLAHLLSTVSPRKETYSPYSARSSSPYDTDPSPEQTTADSQLVIPPLLNGYLDASIVSPVALKLNGVSLSECRSHPEAEDAALTDSIKGLYYLWKAGRKGEADEKDTSVFLRIVQAAIAYE